MNNKKDINGNLVYDNVELEMIKDRSDNKTYNENYSNIVNALRDMHFSLRMLLTIYINNDCELIYQCIDNLLSIKKSIDELYNSFNKK